MHLPAKPERIGPFDANAIRELLEFGRRRLTGDYHVDDFGFDAELVEKFWAPLLKPIGKRYWRGEGAGGGGETPAGAGPAPGRARRPYPPPHPRLSVARVRRRTAAPSRP